MRLAALVEHPRRPGRLRVLLEGHPPLLVDATLALQLDLHVGEDVDARALARLRAGAARLAAFDKASEALARRGRSIRELKLWLARRGHANDDIAAAIEKLTALGLLNDAEFARSFARSRAVERGMSRRRLRAELARRGVARDVIDNALDGVLADERLDESAVVEAVARKKLRAMALLAPEVRRRRLYAFLARRGYELDTVRATVERLLRD